MIGRARPGQATTALEENSAAAGLQEHNGVPFKSSVGGIPSCPASAANRQKKKKKIPFLFLLQ